MLSVSAPFKSGFGGGNDFTDVAAGNIAINNAADLYLFPNTIYGVKVTGATVKDWLETAFEGGRHARRVEKIAKIEAEQCEKPK